jgi:hypothetical protein
MLLRFLVAAISTAAPLVPTALAAQKTRVVILGVDHSIQLVARGAQPAAFRAFFDGLAPDAIAIERDPDNFARNDHYEFTYEIQYLILPYARAHRTPLFPIDWIPPTEDQLLAFGLDLDRPTLLRPATGFQGFLTFPDTAALRAQLLFADAESSRASGRAWYQQPAPEAARDFPRRFYLYRTTLQARRIARAAAGLRGKTLLVMIGYLHKDEIERILAADRNLEIVQPSTVGTEPADQTESATRDELAAIASFNLLGQQHRTGTVDWPWLETVVARLERLAPGSEANLFATRFGRLTGKLSSAEAADRFRTIAASTPADLPFTWTRVKLVDRVDSYIDPFGNLGVRNRARLELARELIALGRKAEAADLRRAIEGELPPGQRSQLGGYWDEFVGR